MRLFSLLLVMLAIPVSADQISLRPSANLLFKQPDLMHPGQCVLYQEGGGGRLLTEPRYYLKGEIVTSGVSTRRLAECPLVPGKTLDQFSRDEFVGYLKAMPCLAKGKAAQDEQVGVLRVRVMDWETPHARKTENAGRLYRGMFLDQKLEKGLEVELEADLLDRCTP